MITLIKRYKLVSALVAFVVLGVIATEVFAGSVQRAVTAFRTFPLPVSQVIAFHNGIGLLDTTNGELFELRGDLDNPSTAMYWFSRAAGVEGTSGLLQVQHPTLGSPNTMFLVDVMTGTTWILRERGNNNASWEAVDRWRN